MADIESLELQVKGNASGATRSINNLCKTLDKLEKATASGCGLDALAKKMKKLQNINIGFNASVRSTGKSLGGLATKGLATALSLQKIGKTISNLIDESNDYVENMNLFSVAMGDYAKSAMDYANVASEVMGIDPSAWIRNQGVFMTLATGFGVAGDRAATMSQQLTQLGYDLSSFFNISVEDAMQKLQSGLSGELEPLRRLGYDLSQAKLEATALSLGIDKSVSSMTQAEKSQLRYYAIMTQVTTAQGDMARTLDAPANQLRIFSAQVTMAGRALGNIFIPLLNKVLPYAIALLKVVRVLADAIAGLVGFEFAQVGEAVESMGNGAGEVAGALDDANKSAKKLKRTLLGIDELNVMPDTSASGADAIGGSAFEFELPTYDFLKDATDGRVNEIVNKMKEWLGITGEITSWADLFDTKLGSILKTAGLIGTAIAAWKIGSGASALVGLLNSSKVATVLSGIATFIGNIGFAIQAVAGGAATIGEAFTFVFGGLAGIIGGAVLAVSGLFKYIGNLISILREGENVTNILGAALGGLASAAGGFLIAIGVGATIATGGIVAAVIAAVAAVGVLVGVIVNHWAEIKAAIANAWNWLYEKVFAPVGRWFASVATAFYSSVIEPIVTGVGMILAKVWEIFAKIVEIAVALGKAFYTYVITPVVNFIGSVAGWVYDKMLKPIINFFAGVGNWLYKTIITPIWDGIKWLKDQAVKLLKAIGTAVVDFISGQFKGVINGVFSVIENNINAFIRLLNAAITIINKIPGVDIKKVTELHIPRLAEGGMVNEGQMFVAREAGPELVGTIGNRSAVVNNDQIVSAVSKGVYQAVVQAMGQSGNQTVEAKVNDKVLFEVIVNRNRQETMRTGFSPLLGGV